MVISEIEKAIANEVASRGCFVVGITVSKDNDVMIIVEKDNGSVVMDDCVAVNDAFEKAFDREKEDYSLTVTSAGLDQPFKVLRQFQKAIGSKVEVALRGETKTGSKKLTGILEKADEESVTIRYSVKESVEGKKKKEMVEHVETFSLEEVNSVREHIEFDNSQE